MKLNRRQLRRLINETLLIENTNNEFGDFEFSYKDPEFVEGIKSVCNFWSQWTYISLTIIIDKTSMPNVTVQQVEASLSGPRIVSGPGGSKYDFRKHLKPMHGLNEPRIRIAEYHGSGKFTLNGLTHQMGLIEDEWFDPIPGTEKLIPYALCGNLEFLLGSQSAQQNITHFVVIGKNKLDIKSDCSRGKPIVYVDNVKDAFVAPELSDHFAGIYMRLLDVIMKHPDKSFREKYYLR